MVRGAVEVRFLAPATRAVTVAAWLASAAFFAWLAWTQASPGHELGYGVAFGLAWLALYFVRTPDVLVRTDDDGFTYVDRGLGGLMIFREVRARWADVRAVDTYRYVDKGGSDLHTRITLRDGATGDTRHFGLTSRSPGYAEFLAVLREETREVAIAQKGLGVDPIAAEAAARFGGGGRSTVALAVTIGLAALGLVVAIVSAVARRN